MRARHREQLRGGDQGDLDTTSLLSGLARGPLPEFLRQQALGFGAIQHHLRLQ